MVSDEGFQEKFPDMFKLIFQKKFQYKPLPKLRINLKINPLQILKGIKLNNFEMEALIIDLGNLDDIELPNYCEKKMLSMENNNSVPMLFPFEPSEFWSQMRQIVKEEVRLTQKG